MEVVNSFFSNIKDKLTNPYFGTLILVLLIHHWKLIFGIFNFDEVFTLENKLNFIQNYIAKNITWESFILDALQALVYMFTGYLIIVLTRGVVLFIEYWLMPFITGRIVNKNVVRRTEYDEVLKEREQYFDQYEEQRNYVRNFSKTIDEQTEQIKQKDKDLLEQTNKISDTITKLDSTKKELDSFKNLNDEKSKQINSFKNTIESLKEERNTYLETVKGYESLYFDEKNQKHYHTVTSFPPEVISKVRELKKDKRWEAFLGLGRFYESGGQIGRNLVTEMIKRGLAFERGKREELTPIGKIIYHYRQVFSKDLY